jgi:hypothetical protein
MFRVVMPGDRRSADSGCRGCGVFLLEVVAEVVIEVAIPAQGAEAEDGFGAVEAPAGG